MKAYVVDYSLVGHDEDYWSGTKIIWANNEDEVEIELSNNYMGNDLIIKHIERLNGENRKRVNLPVKSLYNYEDDYEDPYFDDDYEYDDDDEFI